MQHHGYIIAGARRPLPGPWNASTWTRNPATGLWTNAPVPGAELITPVDNSTFDSDTGWWTKVGAAISGGTATFSAVNDRILRTLLTSVGLWYKSIIKVDAFTAPAFLQVDSTATYFQITVAGTKTHTFRANGTTYRFIQAGVGGIIVDTASLSPLTLSELLAYRNYGRQVSIASALTMTAYQPGGVVSRLSVNGDGTLNFVHCWHDGINLHLDTVVNSYTVVSKVNAAAAYGAGRIIKINFSAANTAQAFYNGVQIGADADISAVPPGTYAGLFATHSTVTLGDPVIT